LLVAQETLDQDPLHADSEIREVRSLPSAWQGRHYTRAAGRPFFGFACL
jgi:hypothetical protein